MTHPNRFLIRMALFLAAAIAAVSLNWEAALVAFQANPALNGVIIGVFFVGVFVCVRQASSLSDEITWLDEFNRHGPEAAASKTPRLLGPIARAFASMPKRGDDRRPSLNAVSARSLLDGLGSRLDESRELARYLVGLLIFLGLLGTFWGLLETVRAVGDVVDGLAPDGAAADTFGQLQSGLRAPLDGMGTAFSSSLFGLAGALALGFLDLQAGQAQNRFYNEVEDWMAPMSRLQSAPAIGDGEGGLGASPSAYVEALLGQTAESLDDLRRMVSRTEEGRRESQQALARTGDRLHDLAGRLETLGAIVERQQNALTVLSERDASQGDPEARRQLAQIERLLERMGQVMANGQSEMTQELRSELRLLGRTLSGRGDGPQDR